MPEAGPHPTPARHGSCCRHSAAIPTKSRALSACQTLTLSPFPPHSAVGSIWQAAGGGRQTGYLRPRLISAVLNGSGAWGSRIRPRGRCGASASPARGGSAARSPSPASRSHARALAPALARSAERGPAAPCLSRRRPWRLLAVAVFGLVTAPFPRTSGAAAAVYGVSLGPPCPPGLRVRVPPQGGGRGGPPCLCPLGRWHQSGGYMDPHLSPLGFWSLRVPQLCPQSGRYVGPPCPCPLGCCPLYILLRYLGSWCLSPPGALPSSHPAWAHRTPV